METHEPWEVLESHYRDVMAANSASSQGSVAAEFGTGRVDEGRRLADFLGRLFPEVTSVLDVGAGNGGVAAGIANIRRYSVVGTDFVYNDLWRPLMGATRVPLRLLASDGKALPFASESFDFVFCLETLEHVRDPGRMGSEIIRVLRRGGTCMVTTPARLRYWFRPDPHYGIRYLLMLPDALQKIVARRRLARPDEYDVQHIFWRAQEVAALFPDGELARVMWDHPFPGPTRLHNSAWFRLRNFLWDRLLIQKR